MPLMIRKLLNLIICLLVLAPQQICTCGAGESTCTNAACPLAQPICPCDHHHDDGLVDADDDDDLPIAPLHKHRDPHQPGCPAVSVDVRWTTPRSTIVHVELIDAGAVAEAIDIYLTPRASKPEQPSVLGPPHVPIFLSLLVLRN
ncbi:MAG TPA: hypothetical protein VHR66_00925 [Gemmataceae bacterium]|jgi:hypothetical protein|nr:hypothetical protein [Gemmataceae bacterium]